MSVVAHLYKTVNQKGRSLYGVFFITAVCFLLSQKTCFMCREHSQKVNDTFRGLAIAI